ncbi:MAG TPA: biosynthetic peptidoglycan transglycosylase [Oligoflexus sp.]|uniref:biosynthetic peptidoglycan transglycosylase n=1 Tax=Oligoflexus sp. TaxID=1971216 RepID=UPI002D6D047B|nr:biosynthetic peptidoglycan transglycosylase [Oligoflexus sp.]HYX36128.1 biosynthetic peptidoglycan transglycosylase [Oligoflexus sp.]
MDLQSFKRFPRNIFAALLAILVLGLLTLACMTPPVWQLKQGSVSVVRWPKSGPQTFEVGPGRESWVSIHNVSRHVINAIVVAEDARFYEHPGLDFKEIRSSIAFNMEQKRYARGASTITQQVVKMVFLGPEKSIFRKFREALGALVLDWILGKDDILEWYINLVEFGDGVFGIKSAADHFFETTPELLTIQDGAHLALVLPSPNRFSRGLRQKHLTEFGHRRYAQIIEEMYKLNFITSALRESALATGDFGKPVEGYNPNESIKDEFIDPYVALPGDEPQPFGKEPPRKKKRSQSRTENTGKK